MRRKRLRFNFVTHPVVVVLLLLFLLSVTLQNRLRLRRFKSDYDEIWQECSLCKYASINEVRFLVCWHTFKMATMTSCQGEKCCRLVSAHAASVRRICSSVRQLLIHFTFVLVILKTLLLLLLMIMMMMVLMLL